MHFSKPQKAMNLLSDADAEIRVVVELFEKEKHGTCVACVRLLICSMISELLRTEAETALRLVREFHDKNGSVF